MSVFIKLIRAAAKAVRGKQFDVDPSIGTRELLIESVHFFAMLLRGLIRTHRPNFLGRCIVLRHRHKISWGKNCRVQEHVFIDALSRAGVSIGDRCSLGAYTRIECTGSLKGLGHGFRMGSGSGIGAFSFVGAAGGVSIGADVIMGQRIYFHSESHNFKDLNVPIKEQGVTRKGILIGDNCWLGSGVTILDGVVVGRGCVVAAGSVLRGIYPENSLIGGVPARVIRARL